MEHHTGAGSPGRGQAVPWERWSLLGPPHPHEPEEPRVVSRAKHLKKARLQGASWDRSVRRTAGGVAAALALVSVTFTQSAAAQLANVTVTCGQVVTQDIRVMNDLSFCPENGLVIGADGITVDLNGHTIDGVGLGAGVLIDGFNEVTIVNGTVLDYDFGVLVTDGAGDNSLSGLVIGLAQESAIQLVAAGPGNRVFDNLFNENSLAIGLLDGTEGALIKDNTLGAGSDSGIEITGAHGNRIEGNDISAASDAGIVLEGASYNQIVGNIVHSVSDAAILLEFESNGNLIEGNVLTSSDGGIIIDTSVGNMVIRNTIHEMSDNGVNLEEAHGTLVLDNDLRFNGEGIALFDSVGTRIESNDTSGSSSTAIALEGASYSNALVRNKASSNGGGGIAVVVIAGTTDGNLIDGNTANNNQGAGISVSVPIHTLIGNTANNNAGWGIYAADGNIDRGNNRGTGNTDSGQCFGVACNRLVPISPDLVAPDSSILAGPMLLSPRDYATITFTTNEVLSRFECRIDSGEYAPCSSPSRYVNLDLGEHQFEVRAIDLAGNIELQPAVYKWTIVEAPAIDCGPEITLIAHSDAWIDQNSRDANKGLDSALNLRSKGPADNFRTLVDFPLPQLPHEDCAVEAATLRLHSDGGAPGRSLLAMQVTEAWTEDSVTWDNQPATSGAVATSSGEGYRSWDVSAMVQAMSDSGGTFGFMIRDAFEGQDSQDGFSTRESDTPPLLVIKYVPVVDASPTEETTTTLAEATTTTTEPPTTTTTTEPPTTTTTEPPTTTTTEPPPTTTTTEPPPTTTTTEPPPTTTTTEAPTTTTTDPPTTTTLPPDVTAPVVSFLAAPDPISNSATASFGFVADEAVPFECSLDEAAFIGCASPLLVEDLIDGSHSLTVRATDEAENRGEASYLWTVDLIAPTVTFSSVPPDPTNAQSAEFEFAATEAGTFMCSTNGLFAACVSGQVFTPLTEGEHTLIVWAIDLAGNTGEASYSWTVELTAPIVTIVPGQAAITNSTVAFFEFSASESSTFGCELDGSVTGCGSPFETSVIEGEHTLVVHAIDLAGNVGETVEHSWIVDLTAPAVSFVTGPAALSPLDKASFELSASEPVTFGCSLDGVGLTGCASPLTLLDLAEGAHSLSVVATDQGGNPSAEAIYQWTVDTIGPSVIIESGPPPVTSSPEATFVFTASEAGTFECAVDSEEFATCVSQYQVEPLAHGAHLFAVRATDSIGNVGPTATRSWMIEPPPASVDCGAPVTLASAADAWIEQNSPGNNKGDDSTLKVKSQGPTDNFRLLIRFEQLPLAPVGCELGSAELRLFSDGATDGRTIGAHRLGFAWFENTVTWSNQPGTSGVGAESPSGKGDRSWDVTSQVEAMYSSGDYGFVIRDSVESDLGHEQSFYSREKSEGQPQLVIEFLPAT